MFDQTTFADTPSAISSPESVDGRSRFVVPDGLMIDLFGPVPHRANLSPRQAKDLGLLTSGTSGLTSIGSSRSADLQKLLENRLRARTSTLGSTLFNLTWKPWVTPSGVSRFRLRASARRTSATETSGWPTPTTRDHKDGSECANVSLNALLGRVVWLAAWTTPSATDGSRGGEITPNMTGSSLAQQIHFTHWPTTTTDARRHPAPDLTTSNITLNHAVSLAGRPTPTSALADKGVRSTEGSIREAMRSHGPDLAAMACLASGPARLTVSGELLIGSSAAMKSGGQLSPEHSRWLMAYPPEWANSAPNFSDWQAWQHLMRQASSERNPTESEPCAVTETP